jgi:ubiquinone/menaquinone biosynthesis C-methylase UbiE
MADQAPSFAGSIPAQYDSKLVPMFFEPFARDIAARLPPAATRVLETAAGTGIVSRYLLDRLGPEGTLVVTDLQESMLDVARVRLGGDARVEIRAADAAHLPFADRDFDAVVCQFGLMFLPDTLAGLREARRVLTGDGVLLFSTWSSLADNPVARLVHEEVARSLPGNAPQFLMTPFGMHDVEVVTDLLHEAGFSYVRTERVELTAESETAHHAATGLLCGSPMFTQLQERGVTDPREIIDRAAAVLADAGGLAPMRLPMQAIVFTAQ